MSHQLSDGHHDVHRYELEFENLCNAGDEGALRALHVVVVRCGDHLVGSHCHRCDCCRDRSHVHHFHRCDCCRDRSHVHHYRHCDCCRDRSHVHHYHRVDHRHVIRDVLHVQHVLCLLHVLRGYREHRLVGSRHLILGA